MATVTHYIYSHYDPPKKANSDIGGREDIDQSGDDNHDEDDPWQTESSFGAQRRLAQAPRFVPALISYDEINDMIGAKHEPAMQLKQESGSGDGVASWYKSLQRSRSATVSGATTPNSMAVNTPSPLISQPSAPAPRIDKNNWFIKKAILADSQSATITPPPSLAEILSRELPVDTDKRHKPPVFLALGPSNRGFSMLERTGWREGDTLGAHVVRRPSSQSIKPTAPTPEVREPASTVSYEEEQIVNYNEEGEVTELRKVSVIDLTMSDDEDEVVVISDSESEESFEPSTLPLGVSPHDGVALLTPIATVLKSDRLGIGLKAKTVGPHKASKKRVTHNQAALAAHLRANEDLQRMKKLTGRGTRGFARIEKAQSESRRQLLASLNS